MSFHVAKVTYIFRPFKFASLFLKKSPHLKGSILRLRLLKKFAFPENITFRATEKGRPTHWE
jgi:hypothetical protein